MKLAHFPLSYIHQIISTSDSIGTASLMLEVPNRTLNDYLARYAFLNPTTKRKQFLTYEILKSWTDIEAIKHFGIYYEKPFEEIFPKRRSHKLEEYSLSDILAEVGHCASMTEACRFLDVSPSALERCLSKFQILDADGKQYPLSFTLLMKWGPEKTHETFGADYLTRFKDVKVLTELDDKKLSEVHSVIKESTSCSHAAQLLGTDYQKLKRRLANFTYRNCHGHIVQLSYDEFIKWDKKEAKIFLGYDYNRTLRGKIPNKNDSNKRIRDMIDNYHHLTNRYQEVIQLASAPSASASGNVQGLSEQANLNAENDSEMNMIVAITSPSKPWMPTLFQESVQQQLGSQQVAAQMGRTSLSDQQISNNPLTLNPKEDDFDINELVNLPTEMLAYKEIKSADFAEPLKLPLELLSCFEQSLSANNNNKRKDDEEKDNDKWSFKRRKV